MPKTIIIDNSKCVRCKQCVTICPDHVFAFADGNITIEPNGCIGCGHCVAVCPADAITHSDYPQGTLHNLDRASYPSAQSLMALIKGRRSCRLFADAAIAPDLLDRIVEAARFAPTATNSREVRELVITDADTIRRIARFTIDTYNSLLRIMDNPVVRPLLKLFSPENYSYIPAFNRMKEEFAAGNDPILHRPKAVILYYTPAGCRFGCQDSNLAYQNASLMAEALGVAHFYTGFVCVAAGMKKNRLQKMLGIEGSIHAGMALGMPAYRFNRYIDRK